MTGRGLTRGQALAAAAAGAGALALPRAADARRIGRNALTPDDLNAVKLLISLEDLQLAVYRHARAIRLSRPVASFARDALAVQERHRAWYASLRRSRSVIPNRPNVYKFSAFDDQTFLALAARVEDAVVGGYNGVLVLLQQPEGLADHIAAYAADEAAHAGAAYALSGKDPVVHSFDDPIKQADTQRILSSPEG